MLEFSSLVSSAPSPYHATYQIPCISSQQLRSTHLSSSRHQSLVVSADETVVTL